MKISEMTNDQAADALIRLSVPFGNICEDEKSLEMINEFQNAKDTPIIHFVGKMLPQITAHMLKTHKDDLYEIVGALTFRTKNAVSKMNFVETVKVIRESYDEVLKSFFTSSVQQMKDTEEKSLSD